MLARRAGGAVPRRGAPLFRSILSLKGHSANFAPRCGGDPVAPDLRPRGRAAGGRGEGRTELQARSSLCAGKFSTLSPPTRFRSQWEREEGPDG